MSDALDYLVPRDPAELGYPPTLPIEIALRTGTTKEICEAYNIDRVRWDELRQDPAFIADVHAAQEALRKDGMSFRMKAQLQSEELLKTSWKIIHDAEMPANVRADLIKFTIRAAGLDGSKDQAANQQTTALQININI